jgi:hypothetical protein
MPRLIAYQVHPTCLISGGASPKWTIFACQVAISSLMPPASGSCPDGLGFRPTLKHVFGLAYAMTIAW